jgi:hypothetical protein
VWVAGVDVPWTLIEALRDDRLVIFVGAGASIAPPSDLPDFRRLAADIAADAGVIATDEELDRTDILLGDLEDQHGVDVHRRVADIIGAEASRPNALHRAIASLAAAGPHIRIVTTNYDLHLSEALSSLGRFFIEETAPALPLGDDFAGIVYLHGSLRRSPRQLVVTDADFGQAYLRDAWATRFLERMFSHYTVLFVGYSHHDVVMSYLGRGLRTDSARFVFTDSPDSPHWRRLRIQPIAYPNRDKTHNTLTDVISGWATWASMGLLDHRQYVAELVAASPSQIPEEMSYLETVVANENTVRFFAEFARGPEWLAWASGRPEFQRLLDPVATDSACSTALASWFASQYVVDEVLSASALFLVSDAGGRLSPALWSVIGQQLHMQRGPRPSWLNPWLVLLVRNAPRTAPPWLEYALVKSVWPEDRTVALLLFDHLTEPLPTYQPSFVSAAGTSVDIGLRGEAYWLDEAWAKLFVPAIGDAAQDVIVIADHHLRRAHHLLSAAAAARPSWDPVSFSRSAIEPHAQDSMSQAADVLINAARDCLEALLDSGSEAGPAYLETWAKADVPLLRRLAVHGWLHRTDKDSSAKLIWLRERGWLFNHQLRHEVFRLIAVTIADADAAIADALVAEAAAGPGHSEHRDYESYNALTWIAQHAPELQSARESLAQAQAAHPEYSQRPYPDLMAWMESGFVGPRPPMSAEELHRRIHEDAAAAIGKLRQYEGITPRFDGPDWEDALNVLSDVVRDWPEDGFAVLDADDGYPSDVFRAIIRGWSAAATDDTTAETILGRLIESDLSAVPADVTRMLAEGRQIEGAPTKWHRFPVARILAVRTWALIEGITSGLDADEWSLQILNHPAGQLAQFWISAIATDWQGAGDRWQGLPEALREPIEVMLATDDERGMMAEVTFASQLHFFHSADRAWCLSHILPLLDWVNPARAQRTWGGFLAFGRFDNQILAAGLGNQYVQTAMHAADFSDHLHQRLYGHLADISLRSNLDLTASRWLRALTSSTAIDVRVGWMDHVGWILHTLPAQAVEDQWHRWMHYYWQERLASKPIQLTFPEASSMAAWVIYLTNSLDEGTDLATSHPAGIPQHSRLLRELTDERIALAPLTIARLLEHLLRGTEPPFYDCHEVHRVVQTLTASSESVDVTGIREQALRLGCQDIP